MVSLGRYLKEYWKAFIFFAALGFSIALISNPWEANIPWFWNILSFQNTRLLIGIGVTALTLLVFSWTSSIKYWRRYRATQALKNPPVQFIDLLAVCIFSALLTFLLIYRAGLIEAWDFGTSEEMRCFITGFGASVLSWFGTAQYLSRKDEHLSKSTAQEDTSLGNFHDTAITDDGQDILGRVPFVDGLYNQITHLPLSNSFVFGLHGSWGEGKTSVLNLLQNRLELDASVVSVNFNPWFLSNEATLIQSFYAAIEQVLREQYLVARLHNTLSRYGGLLSSGVSSLGFGLKIPIRDNPERLRKELEDWIGRTGCRLVILVDEIDRISNTDGVLGVLKLVGLSTRIKNAIFVLSFDHNTVTGMLRERVNVDPSFLEKIIQKPLPLPPAEQGDIDRFLFYSDPPDSGTHRSCIDRLLDNLEIDTDRRNKFDEQITYFYRTELRRLFRTVRDAKRYLNSLLATLPPVVDEVNLYDFVLLEALQVFFPAVYQDIWRSPWFYIPAAWGGREIFHFPRTFIVRSEEKRQFIREHVEQLLADEPLADVAEAILTELFWLIKSSFSQYPISQDSAEAPYRIEKKITHPACFPRYFLFRIPSGELSDSIVEKLVNKWNEIPLEHVERLVTEDLQVYKGRDQLSELFAKLRIFLGTLNDSYASSVIRVLYKSIEVYSHNQGLWNSEYDRALYLILLLMEKKVPRDDMQTLLEEIICKSPSLYFIVHLVQMCHQEPSGRYNHIDLHALRRQAAQRLSTFYIQERRDIFSEVSEKDCPFMLYLWGTDWETFESDERFVVRDYIMGLIEHRPEYLGQVLKTFLVNHPSRQYFDFNKFYRIYDPSNILEKLNHYDKQALLCADAKQAAVLFRQAYKEHLQRSTEADEQSENV